MAMNMAYKFSDIFKVCDEDNNTKNNEEEEEEENNYSMTLISSMPMKIFYVWDGACNNDEDH